MKGFGTIFNLRYHAVRVHYFWISFLGIYTVWVYIYINIDPWTFCALPISDTKPRKADGLSLLTKTASDNGPKTNVWGECAQVFTAAPLAEVKAWMCRSKGTENSDCGLFNDHSLTPYWGTEPVLCDVIGIQAPTHLRRCLCSRTGPRVAAAVTSGAGWG